MENYGLENLYIKNLNMSVDKKINVPDMERHLPVMIEIVPPELGNEKKQLEIHKEYLERLQKQVKIDIINLPEIQDEQKKGEGKRRSKFKERVAPREYARLLSDYLGTEFVINRVIVKNEPEVQEDWLLETHNDYGIKKMIFVGGESPEIVYPGPTVVEGNQLAKKFLNEGNRKYREGTVQPTEFSIGNISIPHREVEGIREAERMFRKIESGADFFTTQIIAESETPGTLLKDLSQLLINKGMQDQAPTIFWSFTPISSNKDVDFLRWLGVNIPEQTEEQLLKTNNTAEASVDLLEQVWERILEIKQNLPVDIPMGVNVTAMGMRNFDHAISLTEKLSSKQNASS